MSENPLKSACTRAEFMAAQKAWIWAMTTEDEQAVHAFAEAIREEQRARIAELERVQGVLVGALEGMMRDVQALMLESDGVAGLHQNGDIAPWGELEEGGRFERLSYMTDAVQALAATQNIEPLAPAWQPIETAPKDRRILVRTLAEVYAATWAQDPETGDVAFCVGRIVNPSGVDDQILLKPTEWMELPFGAQKQEGAKSE